MKFRILFICLLVLFSYQLVFSQRFTRDDAGQIYFIDSTTADTVKIDVTGAVFKIVNTGATFEMTTMTTAQRDALTASNGMIINNSSVSQIQGYANGAWVNLGAGAGGGISNVIEDLSPQLGGDLDANAFDIQFDDADGIHDSNDNEQLLFQLVASAVNYLEITNAATGNEPSLTAIGSDTDVSLTLDGQGAGTVRTLSSNLDITGSIEASTGFIGDLYDASGAVDLDIGSADVTDVTITTDGGTVILDGSISTSRGATAAGILIILEDTDAGSNNATFTVPALAADTDYTLPPDDGDSGEQLQTDGSGVLTWEASGTTLWDE